MDVLIQKVITWGDEKGIFINSNAKKQILKSASELGEICDEVAKSDIEKLKVEIGDFIVTLILLDYIIYKRDGFPYDGDIIKCYSVEYLLGEVLSDMSMLFSCAFDGNCGNNERRIISAINYSLRGICAAIGSSYQECLQLAYDKISKRTGKMENGVFVKDGL